MSALRREVSGAGGRSAWRGRVRSARQILVIDVDSYQDRYTRSSHPFTRPQREQAMAFNFFNKGRLEKSKHLGDRLPPGQYATEKWPVLHYGSVPSFNPATWDFRVGGLVENPV